MGRIFIFDIKEHPVQNEYVAAPITNCKNYT